MKSSEKQEKKYKDLLINFLMATLLVVSLVGLIFSLLITVRKEGRIVFTKEEPYQDSLTKKFASIGGAIKLPGIYEINSETRLADLVDMAGGFSESFDVNTANESLNLAKKIDDGEHVFIPLKETLGVSEQSEGSDNSLININTASVGQLDTLPGIGPSTAEKIIENRPYNSIEELLNVPGIGNSKFNDISELITVN